MTVTATGMNVSNRYVTHRVSRQMADVFRAPTVTPSQQTQLSQRKIGVH
jgi:hypothetical protein